MVPVDRVVVRGIRVNRVVNVRLLGVEEALSYIVNLEVHEDDEDRDVIGELIIDFPGSSDALLDVIAIELEGD
jgi:alpha-L-fucosidase